MNIIEYYKLMSKGIEIIQTAVSGYEQQAVDDWYRYMQKFQPDIDVKNVSINIHEPKIEEEFKALSIMSFAKFYAKATNQEFATVIREFGKFVESDIAPHMLSIIYIDAGDAIEDIQRIWNWGFNATLMLDDVGINNPTQLMEHFHGADFEDTD
jgi:hypothetical protein